MALPSLPVDRVLPEVQRALANAGAVVLRAPTGAGKTTRVPPALLSQRLTLLLEPRRVAARAAARRMAIESGTRLGDTFGYHVRFDRQSNSLTRCLTVTPGILLRMLQDDPYLERIDTILFDEFHERGIEADLALGLCKLLRESVRPDLRIVVMSATVDPAPIARYLGDCPIVASEGRTFPVAIRHQPKRPELTWPDAVAEAIRDALTNESGDILAFLPGLGEIRRTAERLESLHDIDVLPLHGELPAEEQDRALRKGERRRIVLATNVAETSVTVDGVTVVVDSGLARVLRFESTIGMDRLALQPISKASADQRAGRAGRTQPGVCIRLWSEIDHRGRSESGEPEIRRVDLAGPLLQLLSLGESDAFPWLDRPSDEAIQRATDLLKLLGFLSDSGLSPDGQIAARLPVHPRLAKLLIEGQRRGVGRLTALAAACLSDRDPFDMDRPDPTDSDLLDRIHALDDFSRSGRTEFHGLSLHRGGARFALEAHKQLMRTIEHELPSPRTQGDDDNVLQAIYQAYPDRLARRRGPNDRRALLVGGRGVKLGPQSGVNEAELFVAIDVDAVGPDALVRMASAVKRDWLDRSQLTVRHDLEFDETTDRVIARKRTRHLDLVIDEQPGHIADDAEADRILADAAMRKGIEPEAESLAREFANRLNWLRAERPDFELPAFSFADLLTDVCRGLRSLAAVKTGPWLDAMRNRLTYPQLQLLDREAPATFTVPTGSEIRLAYEVGRPPVLAVRIQEIFGLAETPRVAGGKVAVLLHLLSPNYRPQQVTSDLASFWKNGYPVVRKELRGRYPKHSWPDDPLTAEAIRGAKRRSS